MGKNTTGDFGHYGSRRVDYSEPPPYWPLPPPPPARRGPRRYVLPVTITIFFSLFAYFYVNQDEGVYDYWRAVERGDVPMPDDEDDDDDAEEDEWDDEEEDFETEEEER